jgi:hypothetical protein
VTKHLAVLERAGLLEHHLTHTDFPEGHGPAPSQMGWDGGLDKFEAIFAGTGVDG